MIVLLKKTVSVILSVIISLSLFSCMNWEDLDIFESGTHTAESTVSDSRRDESKGDSTENKTETSEESSEESKQETTSYVPDVSDEERETSDENETVINSEGSSETVGENAESTDESTAESTVESTEIFTEMPEITDFAEEASVDIQSGYADVSTADGLRYKAKGYSSLKDGAFMVNDKITVEFVDGAFEKEFNRVTLCYVSTSAMKCTLTYTENGVKKTDSFYLESGKQIFSGLIESYLQGYYAVALESAVFEPLEGSECEFMLYRVVCSEKYVYDDLTYYIENERFKIGIRLVWGGGITYIQDKNCGITQLKNLINIHDAGRLVQQSYYGTPGNDDYQPGVYNGTDWVYNPVQGGDQFWNHSRLIDIIIKEDSVYVKSQPQDWSLNNALTPSYMENTYTVYSDRIVVDNRFVDFSGWEHRFAHQELPAFYTVSYLDRFSYYNGVSPWSGGDLISHDNLPFCGGEEKAQCYFKLLSSNTETWCAWTNAESGFGIGLYVPGADLLLAGRFGDGSSKNPKDNSCSYVAPVNTFMIKSFVPIEYSYMMTTGSIEEIRNVFYDNRDFAENEFLSSEYSRDIRLPDVDVSYENINFATAEHNKYLLPMNSSAMKFNSDHNAVELIIDGGDPQVKILYGNSEKELLAENFGKIVIEYMIPASNLSSENRGEMFLCTGDTLNAETGKSVNFFYTADGAYHTLEIDISELEFWSGKINAIRFDFFNSGEIGDKIFIKSIRLVK